MSAQLSAVELLACVGAQCAPETNAHILEDTAGMALRDPTQGTERLAAAQADVRAHVLATPGLCLRDALLAAYVLNRGLVMCSSGMDRAFHVEGAVAEVTLAPLVVAPAPAPLVVAPAPAPAPIVVAPAPVPAAAAAPVVPAAPAAPVVPAAPAPAEPAVVFAPIAPALVRVQAPSLHSRSAVDDLSAFEAELSALSAPSA